MPRHGENIRKRKDGRWEGRYCIYESQSDKKITRSVYAKSYAEVKEKLLSAKFCAEIRKDKPDRNITFYAVAKEWLDTVEKNKKYATYIKYRAIYEKHMQELRELRLSELDDIILEKMFYGKEEILSESLKKSIACVLNQILFYAEAHYQTEHFRYTYQKQNDRKSPVKVFNQAEQAKLLQYLCDEMDVYKMGILICISTGLRLGEICSLKWADIDLNGKVLRVNTTVQRIAIDGRKTRTILLEGSPKSIFSKREIPLPENMVSLLISYHDASAKYVLNQNKPMEPRTYQNKFQNYLKMAGVEKKNFHTLRHTFATNCINSGADVKSLSEILGHSDVKITLNRYVHPSLEMKRQHMNSLSLVYGQMVGQLLQ